MLTKLRRTIRTLRAPGVLLHPDSCYVLLSDRDESRILSHATTLADIRQLRKQYSQAMGQGVKVTVYKVEELSVVE